MHRTLNSHPQQSLQFHYRYLTPMDRVHRQTLLLITIVVAFLSLTASSDCGTANLGNQNGENHKVHAKAEDQTRIPTVDYTYPGGMIGYPQDPYSFWASMYFPASASGFQDMKIGKDGHRRVDGLKGGLFFNGYPQGFYGNPLFGFGYPYPGGIFGFPRGLFGSPLGFRGYPGGYGGNPGGPGGDGGAGGPGNKPGGDGYPGYGGKAEVKGKEVNSHD